MRPRLLLAIACIATTAAPSFLVGALAPDLATDLGAGTAEIGMIVSLYFLVGSGTSMVVGRVSDAVPPRATLLGALGISAIGMAGVGALGSSLALAAGFLAVAGLGNASAQLGVNVFLARHMPPARQGLAFAAKQSAVPVAAVGSGLAVPLVARYVGWRGTFLVAAACALVLLAIVGRRFRLPAAQVEEHAANPVPGGLRRPLALASFLGAAASGTLGAFYILSLTKSGLAHETAALAFAAANVLGIGVRLLIGRASDHRVGRELRWVALMLALGSAGYAALGLGGVAALAIGTPLAFGAGWSYPGLLLVGVVRMSGAPGRTTGSLQAAGFSGLVAGPVVFGVVADRGSYAAAWLLVAGCALVSAGAIAWVLARSAVGAGVTADPIVADAPLSDPRAAR